jgi:hypothetical protein
MPQLRASRIELSVERQDVAKPSRMHPLMAAVHHTATQSPLFGFPDAVLIRIMHFAGLIAVEILRRTSRTFLRPLSEERESCKADSQVTSAIPWHYPRLFPGLSVPGSRYLHLTRFSAPVDRGQTHPLKVD